MVKISARTEMGLYSHDEMISMTKDPTKIIIQIEQVGDNGDFFMAEFRNIPTEKSQTEDNNVSRNK